MKFYFFRKCLFPFILIILVLFSCSKESIKYDDCDGINIDSVILTKSDYPLDYQYYLLSDEDISAYAHFIEVLKGNPFGSFSKWSPEFHDEQVVYYILDFENGWQILSPDKRGPIVLAYGFGNSPFTDSCNAAERTWLEKLSADIKHRWYNPEDYYGSLTEAEMEAERASILTWRAICSGFGGEVETKGGGNLPPPEPMEPPGHYELVSTYYTVEAMDSIGHLLNTKWGQTNSFNDYCPFEDTSFTNRCPAGCVNVAGSQVLYYLHYYLGIPTSSPTTGYCVGYSHYNVLNMQTGSYSFGFDNFSQMTWDSMDTTSNGNNYVSLFVGSVGHLSQTKFDSSGSGTTIASLLEHAFSFYGISSVYSTTYSTGTVYQSILNGAPVIFGGNRYEDLFSWPGHVWVIDGCVTNNYTLHYVYDWVYDDPDINLEDYQLSIHEPYETTSSISQLKWFKMNWGYYGQGDDNHYLTDGIWVNPIVGGNPYQFNIELAYGYTALQH